MSDQNQRAFVLENRSQIVGPILEMGSKGYGGTTQSNFRAAFPGVPYVGTDLEAGEYVDVVCNFTERAEVQKKIGFGRFQTVLCLSVLEHCWQPFYVAENIDFVLAPGGCLFLSVPFTWRQHGFPKDYWRFTPAAIRVLFPDLQIVEAVSYCTTKAPGKKYSLNKPSLVTADPETTPWYALYPTLLNILLVKR